MTHPSWALPLAGSALVLTPCPGTKGVALADSLQQLYAQGVRAVVTAISDDEMAQHGVTALGTLTRSLGMEWYHLVIEDDCAPDEAFALGWSEVSPALHQRIEQGEKIALHCMDGSGRTGLLAAHLLLEKDWSLEEIIARVQALRPGAFTKSVQLDYVRSLVRA